MEEKMSERQEMIKGNYYKASDKELTKLLRTCKNFCYEYNNLGIDFFERKQEILGKILKKVGNNVFIEPPFYCDYGFNIEIGDDFYANHNLVILDGSSVKIGNNVLIGPNVGIYPASHPISANERRCGYEFAKPIKIGNDVWIGGNSVILGDVEIGNNVVIGAGSVVNRNIPSNTVAVGNPCRVIRRIDMNGEDIKNSLN